MTNEGRTWHFGGKKEENDKRRIPKVCGNCEFFTCPRECPATIKRGIWGIFCEILDCDYERTCGKFLSFRSGQVVEEDRVDSEVALQATNEASQFSIAKWGKWEHTISQKEMQYLLGLRNSKMDLDEIKKKNSDPVDKI